VIVLPMTKFSIRIRTVTHKMLLFKNRDITALSLCFNVISPWQGVYESRMCNFVVQTFFASDLYLEVV